MQVIYIDVLFILNMIMDLFIFKLAALLLNKYPSRWQVIIGSCMAAIGYCVTICINQLHQLPSWLIACLIPIPAILYVFRESTLIGFLKVYGMGMLSAWIVGGIGFNLYYMALPYMGQRIGIGIPIISGIIIYSIFSSIIVWLRKRKIHLDYEYQLIIRRKNKSVQIKSFLDTGNHLYTLDHKPVILINQEVLWALFTQEEKVFIEKCIAQGIEALLMDEQEKQPLKIYLIPFESVGCKKGILIGVSMDNIKLIRGYYETFANQSIIGIAPYQLFKDDDYQGLIHPECVT